MGAHFLRIVDNIMAADDGGAVARFQNGGEHAQGGGLAGAISAEEAIDFAGLRGEADVVDGADGAAFFILEGLRQPASFDHARSPWAKLTCKSRGRLPRIRRSRDLQCTTLGTAERLRGRDELAC